MRLGLPHSGDKVLGQEVMCLCRSVIRLPAAPRGSQSHQTQTFFLRQPTQIAKALYKGGTVGSRSFFAPPFGSFPVPQKPFCSLAER